MVTRAIAHANTLITQVKCTSNTYKNNSNTSTNTCIFRMNTRKNLVCNININTLKLVKTLVMLVQ